MMGWAGLVGSKPFIDRLFLFFPLPALVGQLADLDALAGPVVTVAGSGKARDFHLEFSVPSKTPVNSWAASEKRGDGVLTG